MTSLTTIKFEHEAGVTHFFVLGWPNQGKRGISEADNRRVLKDPYSTEIMIERTPLDPSSESVRSVGLFTFAELTKDAKYVSIKANAEDDDTTAEWYIVMN
eukprot:1768132-Rhodomonas_salina.1